MSTTIYDRTVTLDQSLNSRTSSVVVVVVVVVCIASRELIDCLFLDFFTNSGFNSFVFFLGNLFAHFPVRRIATQDIGIEDGRRKVGVSDNSGGQIVKTKRHGSQQHVKYEPPNAVEQKAKVERDNDANELELRFQAANEETTKASVECHDEATEREESSNHNENLEAQRVVERSD